MNAPELLAIDDFMLAQLDRRGDEQYAHISDAYGCDRATYERRQPGFEPKPFDATSATKMRRGNQVEADIAAALTPWLESRGFTVYRNYRIAWDPAKGRGAYRPLQEAKHISRRSATPEECAAESAADPSFAGALEIIEKCKGCDECTPREGEMVGHIDLLAEAPVEFPGPGKNTPYRVVYEMKSTVFYGKPPAEPKPENAEQCYTYGVAVGADEAHLIVECRATGKRVLFTMNLDALEFVAIARAKAVLEYTDPQALTPPEPRPRYGWQEKYCSLPVCACKEAAKGTGKKDAAAALEASLARVADRQAGEIA